MDTLYVVSQQGLVFGLNPANGTLVWLQPFDLQAQVFGTPAVSADGSKLYVATFDNISGLDESRLWVLDTSTGGELVRGDILPAGIVSSPVLSADGSMVYVGCYDGNLYGIAATTGAVAWNYATPAGSGVEFVDSSFAIGADGTLYIGGVTGSVYAIH